MSDYKRFVSYLYEYIAEKKSDNRGFVKVELRSGICHMQFQLKVFSLPEHTSVTVYGFILIDNTLKCFPLGQLFSSKNGIAGQLSFPSQIPGTAYSVPDFNGLILTSSGGKFYGTQWDETPISPRLFRPASQDTLEENISKNTHTPAKSVTSQTPLESSAEISKNLSPKIPQSPAAAQDRTPQPSKVSTPMENHTQQLSPMIPNHTSPSSQAPEEKKHSLPSAQAPAANAPTPQPSQTPTAKTSTSQPSQVLAEPETPVVVSSASATTPENITPDLSGQSVHITSAATARQPDPWAWVRQNYATMRPFDDDEISDCVRIMINDFPELRAHGFPVGCSQFIHHAFQSYHHLLLGRLVTPRNTRYILGVPGVYNTNEQFMASMFGFNYFKPGRIPKECFCSGKTGYWYRPLG